MVHLEGFGLGNFRSFDELQTVGPLRKVNLIAGQNNSGKSNVLGFVARFLSDKPQLPDALDFPIQSTRQTQIQLAIPISRTAAIDELMATNYSGGNAATARQFRATLERLVTLPPLMADGGSDSYFWPRFELERSKQQFRDKSVGQWKISSEFMDRVENAVNSDGSLRDPVQHAILNLFNIQGGNLRARLNHAAAKMFNLPAFPRSETVQAFRRIQRSHDMTITDHVASLDFNGSGLIRALQQLERPHISKLDHKEKFNSINGFLRNVLEDESAYLEIPSDAETVHVHIGGSVLPLEHLGTGIHQVIILAAAATLLDETLVLMEEPEIHLHPLLQRKLIRYLSEKTTNQYLIATHSAHMLDYDRATVTHAQRGDAGTVLTPTISPTQAATLCADLGYRPSDLIQANAVIWVEGPSDRIYLQHWISQVAGDDLIEGIHYSIMFYGGRLLSHLTTDDKLVREFISLRRLNRNTAILIDSDRDGPRKRINATKSRIVSEFEKGTAPGFAWVTDCRTIENYVPIEILQQAVSNTHPGAKLASAGGKWDSPLMLQPTRKGRGAPSADKVRVAQKACALWAADFDRYDLKTKLKTCVDFIRKSNA